MKKIQGIVRRASGSGTERIEHLYGEPHSTVESDPEPARRRQTLIGAGRKVAHRSEVAYA
jgi:hypothetical protein